MILRLKPRPTDFSVRLTCVGRLKNAPSRRPELLPSSPQPKEHSLKKRTIRLQADLNARVDEAAGKRGFRTGSDFIRHALEAALDGAEQETALDETEQRMIAGLDRIAKEIRSVRRVQQAQFAFVDTLVKVVLTCLPEPGGEVYMQAKARAIARYSEFLKSAGKAMVSDSKGALAELVNHE
jgi:Arc/MetJ-type ribon-helix-helix transcriptional regulator